MFDAKVQQLKAQLSLAAPGAGQICGHVQILSVLRIAALIAHGIEIEGLIEGPIRPRPASAVLLLPPCVAGQEGLSDVPALLYKHGFVWVHADAIIRAMPGGVHIVVAVPILLVSPICVQGIPTQAQKYEGADSDSFEALRHIFSSQQSKAAWAWSSACNT